MTDKVYDDYLERYQYWQGISSENIRLIDEKLVGLSAGAIVFTISIIDVLKPYYNFPLIWTVWLVFTASLISRLLSFVCGEKTARNKILIIGKNLKNHYSGGPVYKHDIENDTRFQQATKILNGASFWLFIIGIALFFFYASLAGFHNAALNKKIGV